MCWFNSKNANYGFRKNINDNNKNNNPIKFLFSIILTRTVYPARVILFDLITSVTLGERFRASFSSALVSSYFFCPDFHLKVLFCRTLRRRS